MVEPVTCERLRKGVAVVTGAGVGLGRALALELVAQGVTVAGIGRDPRTLSEVSAAAGGGFHPVALDVSELDSVPGAFDDIAARLGPVTLLINNAAIYPRREFMEEGPTGFMRTVDVNLGGVAACSHAALAGMVQTGFGRILNVSSYADVAPLPASAGYSVSKGAARILTRALVADLGDRFPGIVISDWMPGVLATRMGEATGLDPLTAARWGARLALWHDPALNGTVFEMDREILPPRSLKRRVLDKLLGRSPFARRL
ncbi:MAG: SDR family oxidoreductase [Rhodobacterales bacterium]|nr:SDR family oxidoreductase [Rhodobacterales bacterium]